MNGMTFVKAAGSAALGLALCACGLSIPGAMESGKASPTAFEVGAAAVPSPLASPVCLGGYALACANLATLERDPLLASAIAFSNAAGQGFLLVKTTNVGFFAHYKGGDWGSYAVRQRIAQEIAARGLQPVLPADHIFVVSDHSHAAPDTIGIWGGVDDAFMQRHADSAVAAGVKAWAARVPAVLSVGVVEGPPTKSSYSRPPTNNPDRQFRALFADTPAGERIATWVNYAPHATVLGSGNQDASGDWTAWAPQEIERLYGGIGVGTVGALGAMDWNKPEGDNEFRENEARQRLRDLIADATAARRPVQGSELDVELVFVREPLLQPFLLLNYLPRIPLGPLALSIERSVTPPWNTGAVVGTYAGAVRIGDVFVSAFPGEPFPELHYQLREGGVTGAQANFLLGAANDFLGYMLQTNEQYQQALIEGALYLGGCPEEELLSALGTEPDGACPDHWVLMVSPTIGRHLVCTIQDAADRLGFQTSARAPECAVLTTLDGLGAPAELKP